MAPVGDVEKMIAVGLIWGASNALMKKGAVIWDKSLKSTENTRRSKFQSTTPSVLDRILFHLQNYLNLIITWQYSLPLALNLTASASFFAILSHTPISLAVPVTNATTFAATAVMGFLLGEEIRIGQALLGTLIIVLGIWLCVS